MRFPGDGQYTFPEGLAPVEIDHARDPGSYWEPNVWIVHTLVSCPRAPGRVRNTSSVTWFGLIGAARHTRADSNAGSGSDTRASVVVG